MKLFIDSSDLDEIKEALSYGCISGVTTNPTTMARAGVSMYGRIREISELAIDKPVSAQITTLDRVEGQGQAALLGEIRPNVVVKVPVTPTGLRICGTSSSESRFNVTLVFSAAQAIVAANCGAWCVSPFLCRWKDWKWNNQHESQGKRDAGREFLKSIVNAVRGTHCQVLAASLRSVEDVEDAIEAGCDIATVSLPLLRQMMQHRKTDEGLAKFMADWAAAKQ